MRSIRTLLHELIDYAGLFPPAGLPLPQAVQNYAAYRAGSHAWALGRFVLPTALLPDFEAAAGPLLPRDPSAGHWRLSALPGGDLAADIEQIQSFNSRHLPGSELGAAQVDTIELRVEEAEELAAALALIPPRLTAYVEVPLGDALPELLAALAQHGARAKVRTGGVTADLIPPAADLQRFLEGCVQAGLPFKATAGLHHPLRSRQRLTYEQNSAMAVMHGFLNVFLAVPLLQQELGIAAGALLKETSIDSFRFAEEGVSWREHWIAGEAIAQARQLALAFGSCSFEEPIADLEALNLL